MESASFLVYLTMFFKHAAFHIQVRELGEENKGLIIPGLKG